ncbi:histidinol-phosphate phosphatase family protein [Leptothrix cholodnii SP-6]|uniref:D-glycero-beta-D-manno-heptose-1,7-bisphosphate 7-phosphatase n=1 Tax=Leptothrix cholodnii (strain ATCC 51168 / LMG 8142 / SP-6) TaxID=395495 RepID=B1Y7P1_LEPCP|nr:D-glycero-beta-D-manno-heptose 1,7-bisphosphate 7-phosphatase [Leptothrix cholodnii]ACB32489.1 histidinol-phosphate phosphatase family protein [Leptothrix cholodnii SP-6]
MSERNPLKIVVVDRDGTLNELRDDHVKTPEEWQPIPGALEAIARLHQAGWHVVVATNQSGLGRGLFDMSTLNAIHQKMNEELARLGGRIDAVFFCPHAPEDHCTCRKPLPGLFEDIADRMGVETHEMHAVGDSLRDMQAARNAGCKTHLVLSGRSAGIDEAGLARLHELVGDVTVHADLAAFAETLIAADRRKSQDARR